MFYVYPEKNLRAYPDILRSTDEWDSTHKIRVNIEVQPFQPIPGSTVLKPMSGSSWMPQNVPF